jgi:hypothetical protein
MDSMNSLFDQVGHRQKDKGNYTKSCMGEGFKFCLDYFVVMKVACALYHRQQRIDRLHIGKAHHPCFGSAVMSTATI